MGDILINGVASDVYRQSVTNGIQEDTACRIGYSHTLRFGFSVSAERSLVTNISTVLPVDPATGNQTDPVTGAPFGPPFTVFDSSSKTGWLIGTYVQDEWKITNQLTLNAGLRFDQMYQYVDANQLSPRISLTWKPQDDTTFHVGYARTFTPPTQVIAAPVNLALVTPPTAPANTQTPAVPINDPVLPERANVFDIGVVQKIRAIPGLEVGIDAYYKTRPRPARRRAIRAGLCAERIQLRATESTRASNSRPTTPTAISAPMVTSPGRRRSAKISSRTSFCSALTNWPSSPTTLSSPTMPSS